MMAFWKHLRTCFSKRCLIFAGDRRGNVAVTFAIATLPMIGVVGYAVDYSYANNVKTALQAALDSAALMLSRDASSLTQTDLNAKALNYVKAMFNRPEATTVAVTAAYSTSGGSRVVVNGSANVPTKFLGIIGQDSFAVSGSSTSAWGTTRLRVALALDNTGSMAEDGKMAALKSATKSLLAQLQGAASVNGDVYVSIIPFNNDVNVGASNYNANWIDWSDWEDDNGRDTSTTTCITQKTGRSGKATKKCTTSASWVPDNHNTWNGCITDRDQSYDQLVTAPNPADKNLAGNSVSTLFPAEQSDSCPLQMMGLSYNWSAMSSLVDQMQPNGNTNQPIGLVWAWQSLVGGGPLTAPAKDSNYTYNDVIILMSDGLNTDNRWTTGYDSGASKQKKIDDRMYKNDGKGTCANIKNAGITIYTVQVNTGGDPTSAIMQNCAGSKDKMVDQSKFYMVTTSSGLGTVFNSIGTSLTQLRVSK